jgi:hypothetical protein
VRLWAKTLSYFHGLNDSYCRVDGPPLEDLTRWQISLARVERMDLYHGAAPPLEAPHDVTPVSSGPAHEAAEIHKEFPPPDEQKSPKVASKVPEGRAPSTKAVTTSPSSASPRKGLRRFFRHGSSSKDLA